MRTTVLFLLLAGCVGSAEFSGGGGGKASGGGAQSGGGSASGGGSGATGGGTQASGGGTAATGGGTSSGGGEAAGGGSATGGGTASGGGSAAGGGTADPCASVSCSIDSHCVGVPSAHCECNTGFFADAGMCLPADPGNPAQRTQQQVCDGWTAGHVVVDPSPFSKTTATCDPGVLSDAGIEDALTRLNMYRWLVGEGPTSHDAADDADDQLCALVSAWNPAGQQAHMPPTSSTCYTAGGAAAAGSSNIAWGSGSPSNAIDQWMDDQGNFTTFGHRRWLINPPLDPIGLGYYEGGNNYGSAACIRVFNSGGSGPHPSFYSFPPPGYSPTQVANMEWTVHGNALGSISDAGVTQMSNGASLSVTVNALAYGYGEPAYWLQRNGWSPAAGETYQVHLTGTGMSDIDYVVMPVTCP